MKKSLIRMIAFYQREISPKNRYKCACAKYYKGKSCSTYVRDVLEEKGLLSGIAAFYKRMALCFYSHFMIRKSSVGRVSRNSGADDVSHYACCAVPLILIIEKLSKWIISNLLKK